MERKLNFPTVIAEEDGITPRWTIDVQHKDHAVIHFRGRQVTAIAYKDIDQLEQLFDQGVDLFHSFPPESTPHDIDMVIDSINCRRHGSLINPHWDYEETQHEGYKCYTNTKREIGVYKDEHYTLEMAIHPYDAIVMDGQVMMSFRLWNKEPIFIYMKDTHNELDVIDTIVWTLQKQVVLDERELERAREMIGDLVEKASRKWEKDFVVEDWDEFYDETDR